MKIGHKLITKIQNLKYFAQGFSRAGHTASEPSVRFTSMNPACGVENIKLYYINNKKCHFSK